MECCICLDECIQKNSSMLYICEHIFHTRCLTELIFNNHLACPLCRNPIINYVKLSSEIEIEYYNNYKQQIIVELSKQYKNTESNLTTTSNDYPSLGPIVAQSHYPSLGNTDTDTDTDTGIDIDYMLNDYMSNGLHDFDYDYIYNYDNIENDYELRLFIEGIDIIEREREQEREREREREREQERINYELELFMEEMNF
jgi:hypothetical protein